MPEVLFTPFRLGRIELKDRAVMSPMTRSRSAGNVPGELVATYYAQRAADAVAPRALVDERLRWGRGDPA